MARGMVKTTARDWVLIAAAGAVLFVIGKTTDTRAVAQIGLVLAVVGVLGWTWRELRSR